MTTTIWLKKNLKKLITITSKTKSITALCLDNGKDIQDSNAILNEQQTFYEKLYTQRSEYSTNDVNDDAGKYFTSAKGLPQISMDDKEELDKDVNNIEIAIKCN